MEGNVILKSEIRPKNNTENGITLDVCYSSRISVIIPFYKSGIFAQALIYSIASQTALPGEVVLVDDGRGDGFDELLKWLMHYHLLARVKLVSSFGTRGPGSARNLGLSLATGELIAFLDADDTWEPQYLEKMCIFHRETGAALMSAEVGFYTQGVLQNTVHYPKKIGLCQLLQTNPLSTPAIIIDRLQTGRVSFQNCHHEDYALWLQFALEGFEFHFLNQQLVNINRVTGSVSSNKKLALRWHWDILKNFSGQPLLARIVLFVMYALNALLKRKVARYRPIFLPCFFLWTKK